MVKHLGVFFSTIALVIGIWLAPMPTATAQEAETATEIQEQDPTGPGILLLFAGLAALGGVGAAYAANQTTNPDQSA